MVRAIGIAIQRTNAASVLGTLDTSKLDEIFYILSNDV